MSFITSKSGDFNEGLFNFPENEKIINSINRPLFHHCDNLVCIPQYQNTFS